MAFFYIDQVSRHLQCPICYEAFERPTEPPCGHVYCYKCIVELEQCPLDRASFSKDELKDSSKLINNMVNELKVQCCDCSTILERELFQMHSCVKYKEFGVQTDAYEEHVKERQIEVLQAEIKKLRQEISKIELLESHLIPIQQEITRQAKCLLDLHHHVIQYVDPSIECFHDKIANFYDKLKHPKLQIKEISQQEICPLAKI